ncbi:putative invertase inhibitor [Miscanthus floridulus]|uniref:putative invertase inhibitor n=1 Tax=Miscanthus floridulus TaxID=154761 RepID=UPI003457CF36
MARSVSVVVVAPLLLLSVLVSAAAAARAVGDTVQDACSKTQFPKICVDSLAAKPESQKATPRKLAELFVNIAAEKGSGMATFVHGKYNAAKDNAGLFKCYDSCSDDVEEAVAHLNGLVREPTDAKFLELKSWLSSTLGGTSTCEDACKDAPKSGDKDDVVNFSLDFEKLQRVSLDLITEASGSMSAGIALPPSDAGAPSYGAAAPADSPAGSEGPAASAASGPSSGGDAPAYGGSAASGPAAADAPAAAAASSGPSGAPAPTSSESSGAPGPSSDGGSSSAPAPSSGDDDDDDDSDADGSA